MNIDKIDLDIIKILETNSKLSFKEIGEKVHMTGQAVGFRVNKLIEEGIIQNFTIKTDKSKLGFSTTAFIKLYMNTADHSNVLSIIEKHDEIVEAFRISSDCCYILKIESLNTDFINSLIEEVSSFANYQISLSLSKVK
ncbi:Lrp/AsnC family transcriptional regulator [uncultured Clostridium sp.]|uniref:Lrp/AsnC family transcriptional regulator n=1 Tax=uncultured Clostridium sp. TaxID=59620 RepID=UPI00260999FF|nr:Lrp/AsnC family transcriptional regulator [uncultured Clostridium sp.]